MSFKEQVEVSFPEFSQNEHVQSLLRVIEDLENFNILELVIDMINLLSDYFEMYSDKFDKDEEFESFSQLVSDYIG